MVKELQTIIFIIIFKLIVLSALIYPQKVDSLNHSKLYPFIVDSIKIIGNKTTEDFIILREINFSVGDTLSEKNAYYNRERVYSLGIFNQVYFIPSIIDQTKTLTIEVDESCYIYPVTFIEAKENDL